MLDGLRIQDVGQNQKLRERCIRVYTEYPSQERIFAVTALISFLCSTKGKESASHHDNVNEQRE